MIKASFPKRNISVIESLTHFLVSNAQVNEDKTLTFHSHTDKFIYVDVRQIKSLMWLSFLFLNISEVFSLNFLLNVLNAFSVLHSSENLIVEAQPLFPVQYFLSSWIDCVASGLNLTQLRSVSECPSD